VAGNGYQSGWGDRQYAGDQAGNTLPDRGGYGYGNGGGYGAEEPTQYDVRYDTGDGQPYYYDAPGEPAYYEPAGDQQDHVTTYRAGGRTAPRTGGPRLPWRELLTGIYRAPNRTFDQMRDHQAWLPAVTVSLLYGVLAVLGFGDTHNDVVRAPFSVAAWSLAAAAVGFTLAGLMLGSVTYALARQFGGDGPYASTVGLAVLIGWTTDAPRLVLALFLPSAGPVVQALGWISWLLCAGLLTVLVRRVHDLPWGKAAGAAAVQLLALLVLIKLPTLG
jgi:hypothetical protein